MKFLWVVMAALSLSLNAQQAAPSAATTVPRLVNFSGRATDAQGKAISGIAGVTFAIYKEQYNGAPLWLETQNVQADAMGNYTVQFGATKPDGLPLDLFTSGEARWLGVRVNGGEEQPRALLLSVPYALKAADAETIGGLPPSAFVLANGSQGAAGAGRDAGAPAAAGARKSSTPPANPDVTGKGTIDYIPMWDTTSDVVDSIIFQKSSGIGINTTTPAALLDVNGKSDIRDTLTLFPKSTDSTLAINGTAFKIDQTGKVTFISGQTFPGTGTITGITTASGSGLSGGGTTGTLSLKVPSAGITNAMLANSKITLNASTAGGLTVPGAMTLGDTYTIGLKTCSANQVLEYVGTAWTCSSAGTGTVTSVATGAGLTGGPITGSGTLSIPSAGVTNAMLANSKVTLNSGTGITAPGAMTLGDTYTVSINTAVVPQLAAANTFTNLQTINAASSTNPALFITNTNGTGIQISAPAGILGTGVYVENAGAFGGLFNGASGGTYSENDTDSDGAVAAYAYEFGTTKQDFGFWGYSASTDGVGVYGQAVEASGFGNGAPVGVWGDAGSEYGLAVLATADLGYALIAVNNSDNIGSPTTYFENDSSDDPGAWVLQAVGYSYDGQCTIDVSGFLFCTGGFGDVAPVDGGARKVALSSVQSPEAWFEDAGSGQLSGGQAVVNIESVFGQTINTGVEYHVFLTPNGDCKGLYVAEKSATSFVVKELGGGTSSIAFDYRIMAKRKSFENVRLADVTKGFTIKNRPVKSAANAKHLPSAQSIRKQVQEHAKRRNGGWAERAGFQ